MFQILLMAKPGGEASKLTAALSRNNFTCNMVGNADNALEQVNIHLPDLFLIEVGSIPESERLCRYLREEKKLPVLAITSVETALNLDGTADDFVLSPLNTDEVIIRAKRLLNKKTKAASPEQITTGDLVIDTVKYEVYISDKPMSLTFREYELLKFLATNPGRVFTRDALLNGVWGEDFFGGDRTVDVHIRRLRGKIEDQTHTYIETVRNIGYRFVKKA
ncbi:MAG TPA: response regulator transcription factor [Dehalococcoidales bacterium]